MRRLVVAIALFAASCAHPAPPAALEAVARWHALRDETQLQHIAVSAVAGDPSVVVAVCEWDPSWWGTFGCFGFVDGQIAWQATAAEEPTEQSILSVRGFTHPEFAGPLIEVLGITHVGNGSLYLYVLEGRRLRLLMKTRAVDCHWGGDGLVFRDKALRIDYRDVSGDGRMDVVLTGTIDMLTGDERVSISWPCAKVFVQQASGAFVEDVSRRLGFEDCTFDW